MRVYLKRCGCSHSHHGGEKFRCQNVLFTSNSLKKYPKGAKWVKKYYKTYIFLAKTFGR